MTRLRGRTKIIFKDSLSLYFFIHRSIAFSFCCFKFY
nr:MAG TPA: hypothetical protein [Caudoviricetes sp.]